MLSLDEIATRWDNAWNTLNLSGSSEEAFETIRSFYSYPKRSYHTLEGHVGSMLEGVVDAYEHFDFSVVDRARTDVMIVGHDGVQINSPNEQGVPYVNNEQETGILIASILTEAGNRDLAQFAYTGICATDHVTVPQNLPTAVLVDEDMSILAASEEKYDAYVDGVRKEYAMYPDAAFYAGRKAFVGDFLKKDRVFHLDFYHARFDTAARNNLRRELRAYN